MQEDTSVLIAGLKIMEPVAAITDLMITVLCVYIFLTLYKPQRINRHWPFFFLVMGVSTFCGAIAHGGKAEMNQDAFLFVWLTMQLLICLANYIAQMATLESYFPGHPRIRAFRMVCLLQLFVFFGLVVYMQAFWIASLNTALSLIPIMIINMSHKRRDRNASAYIAGGISVAFVTAIVHSQKISLHRWFNYKDISHVLIMISFYLMFTGVKRLVDPAHQASQS
jgi:hypothetical protein